jgi:hypothetical protein
MRLIVVALTAALTASCSDGPEQSKGEYASGPLPTAASVQQQVDGTTGRKALVPDAIEETAIGRRSDPEGTIPPTERTERFAAGEEIHLAIKVSPPARPAPVRVAWYGPDDNLLREDAKRVSERDEYVSFSTNESASWDPGEYRAEIWLHDQKIAEQRFAVARN